MWEARISGNTNWYEPGRRSIAIFGAVGATAAALGLLGLGGGLFVALSGSGPFVGNVAGLGRIAWLFLGVFVALMAGLVCLRAFGPFWEPEKGRPKLGVSDSGLTVVAGDSNQTIAWAKVVEVEVEPNSGRGMRLRCVGTSFIDQVGLDEVKLRDRGGRSLFLPRATPVDGGEVVMLAPLRTLGSQESAFIQDVTRRLTEQQSKLDGH